MAWAFYLILAISGVVWIGWRDGSVRLGHFFNPETWWVDTATGVGAAGLLLALWEAGRRIFPTARQLEHRLAELLGPIDLSEVVALALLSGFAEELFFRGAVQGSWGWLPATVLFALLHTGPGPAFRLWTLFAAVAGMVLAALMIWRGNLLAPVVAHGLLNGINLARLVKSERVSSTVDDTPNPGEPGQNDLLD
ncbi:MAG: type II CAAX endopeptidase family protein [Thermoanaerobaculia bacterium]